MTGGSGRGRGGSNVSRGGGRKRSAPGEDGTAVKRGKKCGLCGTEGNITQVSSI